MVIVDERDWGSKRAPGITLYVGDVVPCVNFGNAAYLWHGQEHACRTNGHKESEREKKRQRERVKFDCEQEHKMQCYKADNLFQ